MALYKDVAGFLAQLDHPSQVRHLVDRACRTALAHRTVAVLVLPNDVQDDKAIVDPPHRHAHYATSNAPSSRTTTPPEADLRAAADVLRGGEKVAMPVGQGAYGAEAEVVATAERLGAGVATSLLALPVVDQREPWVTGAIGLLGTRPSWHLMQECDRLLIVGSAMPYSEFYPPEGRPAVQIDVDGAQLGLRYPAQVNLTGDAAPTLRALLSLLDDRDPPTAWRADLGRRTASWRALQRRVARQQADPVNPQRVLTELDDRLPADAMLAVDCGTVTAWCARHLHVRPGMLASLSGTLLSMGGALPYGIAAKFAHPDRPVFALLGDGAMQMNGVNELITVAKYWREWQDPRFVVLVLDNRDLAFVSWEQRSTEGTPKFDAGRRPRRRRPRLGRGAGRGPARRDRRRRRPPRGPDPAARHPRAGRQHHGSGDPRRLRLAGDPASRAAGHRGDVAAPPALTPARWAASGSAMQASSSPTAARKPGARPARRTAGFGSRSTDTSVAFRPTLVLHAGDPFLVPPRVPHNALDLGPTRVGCSPPTSWRWASRCRRSWTGAARREEP